MFYLNRIIKVISPFTFQTFKIELNGEENELRELLATILNINPNSIKGLRDSYNNYYTFIIKYILCKAIIVSTIIITF